MKLLVKVVTGVLVVTAGYFFWIGINTVPSENDSLMWHIPIAENILKGKVWGKDLYQSQYGYYPGVGEAVLALLMLFRIPLNLYNLIGWVLLFVVVRALGIRRGLGKDLATILAVGVVFLPTIMRLFPTQLVDVWLAVWWGWLLWLLEKPGKNLKYWISLGLVAGLIAGTKYTGLILLPLALTAYLGKLKNNWNIRGIVWFAVILILVGGFWYFRNWMVWGDPLYPQNFLWFKSNQAYQLPILWKDLLLSFGGWGLLIQAVFSEYLIWGGLVFLPLVYRNTRVWMGAAIVAMYLILPGDARTVVSNLRYIVPGFIVLILEAGKYFQSIKKEEWLGAVVTVNAVSVLPQLDYHPKVWILLMVGWVIYLWYGKYEKSDT